MAYLQCSSALEGATSWHMSHHDSLQCTGALEGILSREGKSSKLVLHTCINKTMRTSQKIKNTPKTILKRPLSQIMGCTFASYSTHDWTFELHLVKCALLSFFLSFLISIKEVKCALQNQRVAHTACYSSYLNICKLILPKLLIINTLLAIGLILLEVLQSSQFLQPTGTEPH